MFGVVIGFVSCTFVSQRRRFIELKARNEKAFVLVLMSISMLVLTAIGGLGVDLGNWYLNADKLQRSADAAALAGAPYLPGDLKSAYAAAADTLVANGFNRNNISDAAQVSSDPYGPDDSNPYATSAYIYQDPSHPTRLDIATSGKVHNIFIGLIGVRDEYLTRNAEGTYRAAVPMGSPGNVLGSEPIQPGKELTDEVENSDSLASKANSNYWLNIAGGQTDKGTGDRYTAGKCRVTDYNDEHCDNPPTNGEAKTGIDGERAHEYIVHIPSDLTGTFTLQAFDAAYVDVGDHCDGGAYGSQLGQTALRNLAIKDGDDPNLYNADPGPYCTGDYDQGFTDASAITTTFQIYKADSNENATGSVLTTTKFPGIDDPSINLATYLPAHKNLLDSFRKWDDVATFTKPGDYVVEVTTPDNSGGANRFSLRLGAGDDGDWDTNLGDKISVYAKHDLTVYTDAVSPDAAFYFAQLTSNTAGRNLTVELYDIGDVPSGESVDISLLPPSGASGSINFSGFQDCTQTGPNPENPNPISLRDCTIPNATAQNYDGKVVTLNITVPQDYVCNASGSGCWMSIQYHLHGATATAADPSTDTTTWQIDDCGSPVKLVTDGSADNSTCPAQS